MEAPTTRLEGIPAGVPGFHRPGAAGPSFRPERVLDDFVQRAVGVVSRLLDTDERAAFAHVVDDQLVVFDQLVEIEPQ